MALARILVVEDDSELIELLRIELEGAHYEVVCAGDGRAALKLAGEVRPDLILLDIRLPMLDGLSVCREIRTHSRVPILMLSSQGDPLDKVVGLEVGADDYLGKPYHPRELIARVKALLRRATHLSSGPAESLAVPGLEVDVAGRQAYQKGQPLALTPIELELLEALMRNFGRTVVRNRLLESIWGKNFEGNTRTLDTHMRNLRLKLAADSPRLESVRGHGFRLVEREPGSALHNLCNSSPES